MASRARKTLFKWERKSGIEVFKRENVLVFTIKRKSSMVLK